jgi:hypothetical protein
MGATIIFVMSFITSPAGGTWLSGTSISRRCRFRFFD